MGAPGTPGWPPVSKMVMRPIRLPTVALILVGLGGCRLPTPGNALQPTCHSQRAGRYEAMRAASDIVVAEIVEARIIGGPRELVWLGEPKPGLEIPLHLARVQARTALSLRGELPENIEFYCWVWNSGKHGGRRLFQPRAGSHHILFLRRTSGYLHTVGDYETYGLPVPRAHVQRVVAELGSPGEPDLFQRIVQALLRAELESLQTLKNRYRPMDLIDLAGLTSPFYAVSVLDEFCRGFPNPLGRFAACELLAREIPGRCSALGVARQIQAPGLEAEFILRAGAPCEGRERETAAWYRRHAWPAHWLEPGWRPEPERRRLTMRFFASARDADLRAAACEAARSMAEAADIPECR